ncbi:zinc transporter ZupT [Alistipes sp. OttesenSCG-928-B03]|nr:zinc transporter ZupT [Alistipes sp. OttesenSCG-928-B03]
MNENVIYALLLTLGAGLATGVGSAIAFFAKTTSRKFLSFALGLSAGVMIYVSFMELLYTSRIELGAIAGERMGTVTTVIAFFLGVAVAALIDKAVPSVENPHEIRTVEDLSNPPSKEKRLARMGMLTALALAIHNFPEGIATFMSAVEQPEIGAAIAVAIAIHNIPEGIAVSVPIYYATGSKKKAFWYSFLSGLAEPLGAILAWLVLMPFMSPQLLYCSYAAVAGIMVYISLDELLPAAREYGEHHISIYGLVSGMAIMAVSLILLM